MEQEPNPPNKNVIHLTTNCQMTPREVTRVLLEIRRVYTQIFLANHNRTRDLVNYRENHDPSFEEEAGLRVVIHQAKPNLPFVEKLNHHTDIDLISPSSHNPSILNGVAMAMKKVWE